MRKTEISENPAFTFRTFLLRLGLIGPEYKNVREHLLSNLPGDRAWRYEDVYKRQAHRVLGGDDDEGLGSLAGDPVDGDAAFLHHLQQGRLGLGGGAVDLVGQKEVADRRAGLVLKIAQLLVVDGEAGDVRRHDVGGKLHAVVVQREGLGEGHGQGGLAHAGDVVEEDVTLCLSLIHI